MSNALSRTKYIVLLGVAGLLVASITAYVVAIVETDTWRRPEGTPRLISLLPSPLSLKGRGAGGEGLFGLAIDIGTTTVTVYLVNLITGEVLDTAAEYNGQIARGEDVISRIIYASKNGASAEMQALVIETINSLIVPRTMSPNSPRPPFLPA